MILFIEHYVMTEVQSLYQKAIKFAAEKHIKQKVTGTKLPYLIHLSNVAMEIFSAASYTKNFDLEFAVQVALLHDSIEDTSTTFDELKELFGLSIATAVMALTKNEDLPKNQQTPDSLKRIKKLRKEVWAVKLADRITNLQPPPSDWSKEKRNKYKEEAGLILDALKEGNKYLAERLKAEIIDYQNII